MSLTTFNTALYFSFRPACVYFVRERNLGPSVSRIVIICMYIQKLALAEHVFAFTLQNPCRARAYAEPLPIDLASPNPFTLTKQ